MDFLCGSFIEETDNLVMLFSVLVMDDESQPKLIPHHEKDDEMELMINSPNDYQNYTFNLYNNLRNMHYSVLFYKNESENLAITVKTLKDHIAQLEIKIALKSKQSRFIVTERDDDELLYAE